MTYELDGSVMTDRQAAHSHLKSALELPEHYGNNLDALYDILTERGGPAKIILKHAEDMAAALGGYGDMLLSTLQEAAEQNISLEFEII